MPETENKIKVLLIEDDIFMSDLLTQALNRAGFAVIGAKTGADGLKKFLELHPHIILLDLLLPDENGFETLRKIRRSGNGANAKVIILSNLSHEQNAEEARRLGVSDYLVKVNFSMDEIIAKIRSVMRIEGRSSN
ncbi:MAG: response regulator [Candidatus Sungiibacteriota bacterium]